MAKYNEQFKLAVVQQYLSGTRGYKEIAHQHGAAVLAQLPDAFKHFNEVHPHSALGYKSPCMFRKERRRQALETDAN